MIHGPKCDFLSLADPHLFKPCISVFLFNINEGEQGIHIVIMILNGMTMATILVSITMIVIVKTSHGDS